jgi:hypothetical protein
VWNPPSKGKRMAQVLRVFSTTDERNPGHPTSESGP